MRPGVSVEIASYERGRKGDIQLDIWTILVVLGFGVSVWLDIEQRAQGQRAISACLSIALLMAALKLRDFRNQAWLTAESDRPFQVLANLTEAGIYRLNSIGKTTFVNHAWKRMIGVCDGQWLGQVWLNGVHPDDRNNTYAKWKMASEEQRALGMETRWLRSDVSILWIEVVSNPEFDAGGQAIGRIGVVIDIIAQALHSGDLGEATLTQIAGLLHKIAGIAAHFGEEILAERSGELELQLRNAVSADAPAMLENALQLLAA